MFENNKVAVIGEVVSELEFSHEVMGEGFYNLQIEAKRLSDKVDVIPLMVSDRLIDVTKDYRGQLIEVEGQFRSFNEHKDGKSKLVLKVFAQKIGSAESVEPSKSNHIYIEGFICKEPSYRTTPLGREISDILLAINRAYGKSDYVPCIVWGRNARFASNMAVGTKLKIWGRIQSREYVKKLDDREEVRTAYEVSVSKMECTE